MSRKRWSRVVIIMPLVLSVGVFVVDYMARDTIVGEWTSWIMEFSILPMVSGRTAILVGVAYKVIAVCVLLLVIRSKRRRRI